MMCFQHNHQLLIFACSLHQLKMAGVLESLDKLINLCEARIKAESSKNVDAEDNKTDRKEEDDDRWTLYYWGLKNRGNWVRLLFAEANVKYNESNDPTPFRVNNPKNINKNFPVFAPPFIIKGNINVSQSSVIIDYLSELYNLYPKNKLDILETKMIFANCNDLVGEIYSFMNKEISDKTMKEFFLNKDSGRFQGFIKCISHPLSIIYSVFYHLKYM